MTLVCSRSLIVMIAALFTSVSGFPHTPRVANEARVRAIGLAPGKNACPKYRAAAV